MHSLDIHTHRLPASHPFKEGNGDQRDSFIFNMDLRTLDTQPIPCNQVSLGLHPWYFTEETMEIQLRILESQLGDPRVKMIGECGFDRIQGPSIPIQKLAFQKQVALAEKYDKPLIIHCVKAFDELIACKKTARDSVPMIIHGFNKSPELGRQLIDHGFLLSFGASILKEGSPAAIFLDEIEASFFLETDDSGLDISEIYEKAAYLRNISIIELKDSIFAAWNHIGLI